MTTLVLTDNPRSGISLRAAFGDGITVREIPLPLYKVGKGPVTLNDSGRVSLSPVTKHIAELRKLASRFSVVLVVTPPVPFWHEIGWSIRKALAGIPIQLLFYFPSDLTYGLDVEPLSSPLPTHSSVAYACDTLIERNLDSLYASLPITFTPKPLMRRSVVCSLAALARMYEVRGRDQQAMFSVWLENTPNSDPVLHSYTYPSFSAVVGNAREPATTVVSPEPLLTANRLPYDVLAALRLQADEISRSFDFLYAVGAMSHPEVDSTIPDPVHTWAVSVLLEEMGINPEYVGTGPTCGVYVTGSPLPAGTPDATIAIYEYVKRRTLQSYCLPMSADFSSVPVDFDLDGNTTTHHVVSMTAEHNSWAILSDRSEVLACLPSPEPTVSITYDAHYAVSAHLLYSTLLDLGMQPREILSSFYYLGKTGVAYVGKDIALTTYGFYVYSLLSRSSSSFTTPDLFSLGSRALQAEDGLAAELLTEADLAFKEPVLLDLTDVVPSVGAGLNIDPATMTFQRDSEVYGVAINGGQLVPIQLQETIVALCPSCGSTTASVVLNEKFCTARACSNPNCSSPTYEITLMPTLHQED